MKIKRIYKKRALVIIIAALVICLFSCTYNFQSSSVYHFKDDSYRYMVMTFNKDSSIYLENRVGQGWGFLRYGKWSVLSDSSALISIHGVTDTIDSIKAPQQGEPINSEILMKNKGYAFPLVLKDTVFFSDKWKVAFLKGYMFSLESKGLDFHKFSKKIKSNK